MYPAFFQNSCRRKLLLLAISVGSFLIGLLMVTEVRGESPCCLYFVTYVARSTNYQNETSIYLLYPVTPVTPHSRRGLLEPPVQNITLEIQFRSDTPVAFFMHCIVFTITAYAAFCSEPFPHSLCIWFSGRPVCFPAVWLLCLHWDDSSALCNSSVCLYWMGLR